MGWEKKCWGSVLHCFEGDHAAVSILEVDRGFRCSKHYHEHRANQFTVITGEIRIERWNNAGEKMVSLLLRKGHTTTIWPGMIHRFVVLQSGCMVETYWTDDGTKVSIDDIIRLEEGGPNK